MQCSSHMMSAFHEHAITALWLAWLIYWCAAAIGAKRTRRHEKERFMIEQFGSAYERYRAEVPALFPPPSRRVA